MDGWNIPMSLYAAFITGGCMIVAALIKSWALHDAAAAFRSPQDELQELSANVAKLARTLHESSATGRESPLMSEEVRKLREEIRVYSEKLSADRGTTLSDSQLQELHNRVTAEMSFGASFAGLFAVSMCFLTGCFFYLLQEPIGQDPSDLSLILFWSLCFFLLYAIYQFCVTWSERFRQRRRTNSSIGHLLTSPKSRNQNTILTNKRTRGKDSGEVFAGSNEK